MWAERSSVESRSSEVKSRDRGARAVFARIWNLPLDVVVETRERFDLMGLKFSNSGLNLCLR